MDQTDETGDLHVWGLAKSYPALLMLDCGHVELIPLALLSLIQLTRHGIRVHSTHDLLSGLIEALSLWDEMTASMDEDEKDGIVDRMATKEVARLGDKEDLSVHDQVILAMVRFNAETVGLVRTVTRQPLDMAAVTRDFALLREKGSCYKQPTHPEIEEDSDNG